MTNTTSTNNKRRAALGRKAFTAYAEASKMEPIERRQDYSITDCIVDLLHFAASRKQDAEMILRSADNHFTAETPGGEDFEAEEAACREIIQGGKGGKL